MSRVCCRRMLIGILVLGMLPQTALADFVPFEIGVGSGRALCSFGQVSTTSDEYENQAADSTAECTRGLVDPLATAVASTVFEPSLADAALTGLRGASGSELNVNARAELDYSIVLIPIGEPQNPPFVPVLAAVPYVLAASVEGELRGGCTTNILIEQTGFGGRIFGFDEARSTRFDGVAETGSLEASLDMDPSFLGELQITAICGGFSNPPEGAVDIEAQAQVGQMPPFEPIVRFDQERLDEELGEQSFPLEEAYQIVYIPMPEPRGALGAAVALAAVTFLRRCPRAGDAPS